MPSINQQQSSCDFIIALTDELKTQAYRMRFQVYCIETKLESPTDYPNGLEIDRYDSHSMHVLLRHIPTNTFIGHARVVFPTRDTKERFPVQEVCNHPILEHPGMAEVSRLCISMKRSRKIGGPNGLLVILIKALVEMSRQNDVSYWCGLMEPRFLRRLSRLGIYFNPIGELIFHHGCLRQPVYQKLGSLLDRAHEENPEIWG